MILVTPTGVIARAFARIIPSFFFFLTTLRTLYDFTISQLNAVEVIDHKLLDEHVAVLVVIYIHLLVPEQLP